MLAAAWFVTIHELATANRRIQHFTDRYARPVLPMNSDLSVLRSEAHLGVIEPYGAASIPASPRSAPIQTEIMDRLRVERAGRAQA